MKSLLVVFGAILLIIALPAFFQATHDAEIQAYTETFAGITTGAGVYSSNTTLSEDLYDDNVISVLSISSNSTNDSPSATTYNSVNRLLSFGGLADNLTRTLSVEYEIDSTLLPTGAGVFLTVVNWFYVFTIIGMIAGAIYAFFD